MRKLMIFVSLLLILFPLISASATIDSEMQKITHYAEEYETGNINYAQLLIYLSSAKQGLNNLLGATDKEYGGILEQEQIENVLGKPQYETKWVWVQDEEREKKVDSPLPIWEKIIFDGKKISIKFRANPFIYKKINDELKEKMWELEKQGKFDEADELKKTGEENLGYNLNFEIDFKEPKDVLNLETKIKEIQSLAELFNKDPSKENAENLAEESVNAERSFESYSKQNSENCEDFMKSLFGSEYLRETAEILSYKIDFYEGENFEAIIQLEMCEECQWNWINMNMWYEGRGKFKPPEMKSGEDSKKDFEKMNIEEFKTETTKLIESTKSYLQQGDISSAMKNSQRLNSLTNVWNEKSNDVWKQAEELIKVDDSSMTDKERNEFNQNYGWIKLEQQRREKVKELQRKNFEERKNFYLTLFSNYEYTESYIKQMEFEKRLIQEFKIIEQEKCDNNQDDNQNGEIDCADSECSGKFCGTITEKSISKNETSKNNLYCIAKVCQQKEELIKENISICGNNICEFGEELKCTEDCANCPIYPAIECLRGRVVFSGKDEKGCMLKPICVEENLNCKINEDCFNPLCGKSECIEGICQVTKLEECKEKECVEGQEKMQKCSSEELVVEICKEGLWLKTGIECNEGNAEEEIVNDKIVGQECIVKDDCGGENDVCSNGKCITLPSVIENEKSEDRKEIINEKIKEIENEKPQEEIKETVEEPEQEESIESESLTMTGQAIFGSIKTILTGWDIEGGNPEPENPPEANSNPELEIPPQPENSQNPETNPSIPEQNQNPENNLIPSKNEERQNKEENKKQDEEKRHEEEKERRKKECVDRCSRECNDRLIRPCVEDCVWKQCGNNLECNLDDMTKSCESTCKSEKNTEECEGDCYEKCMKNEETWMEPEQKEQKQEKGVFNVGGGCRSENTKTNAFLWFNGWGEPFEQIQPLKEKYYSGGQADWCKWELEDLQKQRKEFENSFNYNFAVWFFEKYLTNSAEDWEQSQSGIYDIYWQGGADISRQIAERMNCLDIKEIPFDYKLINFTYETEYGRVEYWEEIKTINLEENNKEKNSEQLSSGQTEIISPYMKVWIFPPKEFIISQTKKAMKEGKFPGSKNNKEKTGPTEQEKEQIKQDDKFMEKIIELSDKYGGSFDVVVQLKNYETDEIVFNLYAKINEQEIIEIKPMLPEEIPEQDAKIIIDFDKVYNLIYLQEKEMRGSELESPPWDKKPRQKSIKQITNNVKKGLQIAGILNSAEITPEDAKKDFNKMFKSIFKMIISDGGDKGNPEEKTEETEKEKSFESLSGDVIQEF